MIKHAKVLGDLHSLILVIELIFKGPVCEEIVNTLQVYETRTIEILADLEEKFEKKKLIELHDEISN